jgi:hypothetical protein
MTIPTTTTTTTQRTLLALSLLLASFIGACSDGYVLRGRVIESDTSFIAIVDPADPRLTRPGVPSAQLHLQMDPARANRETITRQVSGLDGEIALRVDRFGAGWMEYDVGLFARKPGFTPAQHFFRLPPKGKRILIMMAPGRDHDLGEERDMSMDDYDRFR